MLRRWQVGVFNGDEFLFSFKENWFQKFLSNQGDEFFEHLSHKLHMRFGASYDYHTENDYVIQWR